MNIAVIPARSGSKRIPRKNIKEFAGRPMIAHVISSALKSKLFEHVVVSTDDNEIAHIARDWGAETPFMRPIDLANDFTATVPVVAHAISACAKLGMKAENVCCIYPCAPFIHIDDLSSSLKLLDQNSDYFCFPVAEFPSPVQRSLYMEKSGKLNSFYPEYESERTQDLEPSYFDVGQFYWGKASTWLNNSELHKNSIGMEIPSWRSIDIDDASDWTRAEHLYKIINSGGLI